MLRRLLPAAYLAVLVPLGRAFDRLLVAIGWAQMTWEAQMFACTGLVVALLGVMLVPLCAVLWRGIKDSEWPGMAGLLGLVIVEGLGCLVLPLALSLLEQVVARHPGPVI